jgi:prolyl-tRNA synthetase
MSTRQFVTLIDPDAANGGDWATGSDRADHHDIHFDWKRDAAALIDDEKLCTVTDIRDARAGDPSPRAPESVLMARRGIEVGHIFKLGDKYSKAMNFEIMDQDQQRKPVIMGCYGIGVSRTMAACVEMSCDDNGIVWPMPIAPYHALITALKPDAELLTRARALADTLAGEGFDVLIDDRDERPGAKFKDADLIGIPARYTLSAKSVEAGGVEFKLRSDEGKGEVMPVEEALERTRAAATV